MLNEAQILALLSFKGVGPTKVYNLMLRPDIGSPEALAEVFAQGFKQGTTPDAAAMKLAHERAEIEIDDMARIGIAVLGPNNPLFPAQLRMIPKPPVLLYAKGNIEALSKPAVAVIGTRDPTAYGVGSGRKIAARLAERGLVIVSGLAEGCDTAGHEGCLDAKGETVAVLAHGHGQVYPPKNADLAKRIIAENGCLVSEYRPGTEPSRYQFIERDRLQSGLSRAVFVVETGVKGGTMHTVGFALLQQRILAALEHSPKYLMHEKALGNRQLIFEAKAMPIKTPEDVQLLAERALAAPDAQPAIPIPEPPHLAPAAAPQQHAL